MSMKSKIIQRQLQWAADAGLGLDDRGYLACYAQNLLQPLNDQSKAALDCGSGSELRDSPRSPAKAKAPHSSSVLAINFFDYWVKRDARPLLRALEIEADSAEVRFEEKFPTGVGPIAPHLDVVLVQKDGFVNAIESKFTEWMSQKSESLRVLKPKYFENPAGCWSAVGLGASQKLANAIQARELDFCFLDVPQLLKHALGLATQVGNNFCLYYLYFEGYDNEEATSQHRKEIEIFHEMVGDELGFVSFTYQALLSRLRDNAKNEGNYLEYLSLRYG